MRRQMKESCTSQMSVPLEHTTLTGYDNPDALY